MAGIPLSKKLFVDVVRLLKKGECGLNNDDRIIASVAVANPQSFNSCKYLGNEGQSLVLVQR